MFFNTDEFRDEITQEFLDPNIYSKTITLQHCNKENKKFPTTKKLFYEELIDENNNFLPEIFIERNLKTHHLNVSDSPTRMIGENCNWYKEHGFFENHQELEKHIGFTCTENTVIICPYNISSFNESEIKTIIEKHGYVILEKPFSIYKFEGLLS